MWVLFLPKPLLSGGSRNWWCYSSFCLGNHSRAHTHTHKHKFMHTYLAYVKSLLGKIQCSELDLGKKGTTIAYNCYYSQQHLSGLSLSRIQASALDLSESIFRKYKATLEFSFCNAQYSNWSPWWKNAWVQWLTGWRVVFQLFILSPLSGESKSWQLLSDSWMRTREHIDNQALCSSPGCCLYANVGLWQTRTHHDSPSVILLVFDLDSRSVWQKKSFDRIFCYLFVL